MKKKTKALIFSVIAICFVAAFLAGFAYLKDNRFAALQREGLLRVYPGITVDEVVAQISENCGILYPESIRRTFEKENVADRLKPGSYMLEPQFTARYIARMITRGWQHPVNLVIAGRIRTVEELAHVISSQMLVSEDNMLAALKDSVFLAGLGTTPSKVFEIIIPDTYEIYWDAAPRKIVERLKAERDFFWTDEKVRAAAAQGLTPEQVSVIASIVSEESNRPDEYPKIASVYITRYQRNMKLQACPTICYLFDYKVKRVLNRHLKTDSPYNTYIYEGLPPGPIALPDKSHIEAVLHPDSVKYLYFCADSAFNGRNVFSRTYAEHVARKEEYIKAFENREKQKALEEEQKKNEDPGPAAQ